MKVKDHRGKLGDKAGMSGAAVALTSHRAVSTFGQPPNCRPRNSGSALQEAAGQMAGRTQNLKEQSGNVHENKRPLSKSRGQSRDMRRARSADPAWRGQHTSAPAQTPISQLGVGAPGGSRPTGGPHSKIRSNNAGMLLKIKYRCGRLDVEAGMYKKTKHLIYTFPYVIENKCC
jgi:hypothetical protein